jgi:hypothetical protein
MTQMLSDRAKDAIKSALAKKGPRQGLLLSSAPKGDSDAFAAWSALMIYCNPYKVGLANLMMMEFHPEQKALHKEVESWFLSLPENTRKGLIVGLDKDRLALQTLGVW